MCKFCEGYDRKNSGKFAIYMTKWSDERGTTLSVDFDGFDESSDTDFEVNFCPMCGKQLKQVQESTELTEAFKVLRENGYILEERFVNVDEIHVPEWLWVAYETGDTSNLEDEEIEILRNFEKTHKDHQLEANEEPNFYNRNDVTNEGGMCYTVQVFEDRMNENLCESNKHFELWQYKLQVKKNLNNWIKTQKWFKNFDDLRASISWELYIDIVKETMKFHFDAGSSPDDCAVEIIEMAKEAAKKG